MTALLEIGGLDASYDDVAALRTIDLDVQAGEVVALLGANGAGKTSVLRAVSRMVRTRGTIMLDGRSLAGLRTDQVCRLGVGHVPEGRGTIAELTVAENLRLGLLARPSHARTGRDADLREMLDRFPVLAERRHDHAGALSGGQQQTLAIARALLARPRLLLLDEPSLGLAPITAADIFEQLDRFRREWGLSVLIAEQNVRLSLGLASRAYVLESGRIALSGSTDELAHDPLVERAYLGA